jgi:hypothetical protein
MIQALTPGSFLKPSPPPMLGEEGRKDTERCSFTSRQRLGKLFFR